MSPRRLAERAMFFVCAGLSLGAKPLPDLAVPREGLRREGGRILVVVENRGDAPSNPTTLLLSDRSPLGGPTGTSALYPFTPNRNEITISQEPAGADSILLGIGLGAGIDGAARAGSIRLDGFAGTPVVGVGPGVRVRDGGRVVAWDSPSAGRMIRIRLLTRRDVAPRALLSLDWKTGDPLPIVFGPTGEIAGVGAMLDLDALQRERARRTELPVPALEPGGRRELAAEFEGGARDEVFAWVDPADSLDEIREGNNVACWRNDRDRLTLGALHLHSSFSEGAGSVDWQALLAAASGYDLLWWSEHDWRIACRDHVEMIGFEPDETIELDDAGSTPGTWAGPSEEEEVEQGAAALQLLVPRRKTGRAVATLTEPGKRLSFSLAAQVTLELRVLARGLDRGDRFSVLADLSHHPGEKRRIEYVFRWDGVPADARDASDSFRRAVPRTIATGSWVPLTLPLSRDALELWANGLDDNVQALRFTLTSKGSGASVLVDDVRIRHEACGAELRRVQESWMPDYPNVEHLFADEVSYSKPHLNQYGGPRGLFDYEEIWDAARVAPIAERIHAAGGVVSWCHPLGLRPTQHVRNKFGQAYQDSLLETRFGNTDLLEVGFRRKGVSRIEDYLSLWDAAGRRGIVITGIGVNDSHEWDWGSWENNFGTWIAAPADDANRLLAAIRGGRAVLGDPLRFRGTLAIACGTAGPGDVVVGSAPRDVTVRVSEAPAGARVRLVADSAVQGEWVATSGTGEWSTRLEPGKGRVVRAEVWGVDGSPLAFTNPIYFDEKGELRRP